MIKDKLRAGVNTTIYMDFIDEFGNPQILDNPPNYVIRDKNKALILAGIAEQATQAQRWQTNITIPNNAPPGDYNLIWSAVSNKSRFIQTDSFKIVDSSQNFYELDLLLPEKSVVSDQLTLDADQDVSSYSVKIQSADGDVIYQSSEVTPQPVISGDKQYINFSTNAPLVDLTAGRGAFAVYLITHEFTADDVKQVEHNFVYVVNPKILMYVNELKRRIDRAATQNPNAALRYNSVDLVAFINVGLQWINAQPPTQTSYTLSSMPDSLYSYLLDAASVEALSSRYLAEGEAAFNFSGQPIQFEVDRTGFLDTAISRYQTKLENLPLVKKGLIMSGNSGDGSGSTGMGYGSANSSGVLTLSRGPNTTFSLFPMFDNRVASYENVLYNLGYT